MLAGIMAAYLAVVFFSQRALIFPAPVAARAEPPADIETISLAGRDGSVEAWFLRPTAGDRGPAPRILTILVRTRTDRPLLDHESRP